MRDYPVWFAGHAEGGVHRGCGERGGGSVIGEGGQDVFFILCRVARRGEDRKGALWSMFINRVSIETEGP